MSDLYWEEAGAGSPVVLVHEAVADSGMWDPQWETFPRSHRTIRLDMRGYGRSPLGPGVFSHARDVVDLLNEVGLERTALVGGSLGGRVALEVAVAQPERIEKLVLLNPGGPGHAWSQEVQAGWAEEEAALDRGDLDAAVAINMLMWFDGPRRSRDDVDSQLRAKVARMQRRALEVQMPLGDDVREEQLVPDLSERLGEVQAPTLVVTGDDDVADIHAIADRLVREIPDARRATMPGAHVASLEHPDEFDRIVLEFLS